MSLEFFGCPLISLGFPQDLLGFPDDFFGFPWNSLDDFLEIPFWISPRFLKENPLGIPQDFLRGSKIKKMRKIA